MRSSSSGPWAGRGCCPGRKRVLRAAAATFPFSPDGASLPASLPHDCPLPSRAPPLSGRPSIALSAPPAIGCLRSALAPQLRSELPGRLLWRPKMSTANDRAVLRSLFHPNAPFGAALAEEGEDPPTGPEEEGAFDPALLRQARALETAGVAAAEAGDVEGALERFGRAIRLLPERASAYNNRAQALRLKGDVAGVAEPGAARDGRAVSCVAPAPSLAWYLDGEQQQESDGPGGLVAFGEGSSGGGFAVTARRLDRQLNCSSTDGLGGPVSSTSVLLDVQFRPELVAVEAQFPEGGEPGVQLALLVLVRAHPPANITWVDRDGQRTLNTSRFLIVGAQTFPWPADHPLRLRLQLGDPAQNASFSFEASGLSNASVPLPGFLDTRVELPILALLLCGTATLGMLLALGALLGCLGYRKGKAAAGLAHPAQLPLSSSCNLKPAGAGLPRAIRSLPANWQLHDFAARVQGQEDRTAAEQGGEALSEPEDSLALAHRGLGEFPMVGYIYRASSMSSDEIWL